MKQKRGMGKLAQFMIGVLVLAVLTLVIYTIWIGKIDLTEMINFRFW